MTTELHSAGGDRRSRLPFLVVTGVSLLVLALLRPDLILLANTPSGGDMGAHVLGPQILRDVLLPSGQVMGWSDAWFAGFPAFYFYFPLPSLVIVLLDLVLPYGVAFKMVTVAGLVATPSAAYYLARSLRLTPGVSSVVAATGAAVVVLENFTIYGANAPSTLAGEFSFSWSFALGVFYLGALIRAVRDDRRYLPLAALLLGLTALSHVITTMMFVLASLAVLFWKNGRIVTVLTWVWGFAISAWWALPLLIRIGHTADMAWSPLHAWDEIFPVEIWLAAVPALAGAIWLIWYTDRASPLMVLMFAPVLYFWLPTLAERLGVFDGIWKLWNGRILPFWFFGVMFCAGVGLGTLGQAVARRLPSSLPLWAPGVASLAWAGMLAAFWQTYPDTRWWAIGLGVFGLLLSVGWLASVFAQAPIRAESGAVFSVGAAALVVVVASSGISFIPGWARWNFSGYEGKSSFDQYEALMETIDLLPPGRVQWEANHDLDQFGTPMALMLTPYWSEEHPSMEGLFFESSITTPFHFLNAGELSFKPSNPIPGLDYHTFDFDRGIAHMETYGVTYYVSFTDEATEEALGRSEMIKVAESEPFTVFTFPETDYVTVATHQPVVLDLDQPSLVERLGDIGGRRGEGMVFAETVTFNDVGLEWYSEPSRLNRWITEDGPADWPRISDLSELDAAATPLAIDGSTVSDIVVDNGTVSFTTDAIGVPHLVKVSYFPNWEAEGAAGPYRASPSLMVVVPTDPDVTLTFARQWPEQTGLVLAAVGLSAWAVAVVGRRLRGVARNR